MTLINESAPAAPEVTSTPAANTADANSFEAMERLIESESKAAAPEKAPSEKAAAVKSPDTKTTTEATAKPVVAEEKGEVNAEKAPVDAASAKEEAAAAAAAEQEAKTFKLKTVAGREVEIPTDAKVMKKIDGVEQEVSIKEALDQYAGKVVYDKKFTELDQRDKSYLADKEASEKQLNSILEKAVGNGQKGPDALGAILQICKLADVDPAVAIQNIKTEIIGDMEAFMAMSPQERETHFLRIENKALRQSKESETQSSIQKQAQAELESKASEIRETYKLSDEDVKLAQAELRAADPALVQKLYGPKGPDATQIAILARDIKFADMAKSALEALDPELSSDLEMVHVAAVKLAKKPELTVKEASDYLEKSMRLQRKATEKKEVEAAEKILTKKLEDTKRFNGESGSKDRGNVEDDIYELNRATNKKDFPISFDDI